MMFFLIIVNDAVSGIQYNTLRKLSGVEATVSSLAFGPDPNQLLSQIRQLGLRCNLPWTIDYQLLLIRKDTKNRKFSSRLLFCAISQLIQGPPALIPEESKAKFLVYETENGLHLCRDPLRPSAVSTWKDLWSKRPFQYSAALNFEVTVAILNVLVSRVPSTPSPSSMVFYDPCCGSGTTLFVAARFTQFISFNCLFIYIMLVLLKKII